MTPNRFALAFLACALAFPAVSNAGLITWELGGTIERVDRVTLYGNTFDPTATEMITLLESAGVASGASFSARIAFDSDALGHRCEECIDFSEYYDATKSIEFFAGSFAASTPDGATGNAWAGVEGADPTERSILSFEAPLAINLPAGGESSGQLVFARNYPTPPFGSSLPTDPPDVSTLSPPPPHVFARFIGTRFALFGSGFPRGFDLNAPDAGAQRFLIDARITSITSLSEPFAFALLLAAAAASAIRGRSRALP